MTDNVLHAALTVLLLALVCVTSLSYRSSVLADERLTAQRAGACRVLSSAQDPTPHEAAHSACS